MSRDNYLPWSIRPNDTDPPQAGFTTIIDKHGRTIARVYGYDFEQTETSLLFAAAPEMLRALKHTIRTFKQHSFLPDKLRDVIEVVILKVERNDK